MPNAAPLIPKKNTKIGIKIARIISLIEWTKVLYFGYLAKLKISWYCVKNWSKDTAAQSKINIWGILEYSNPAVTDKISWEKNIRISIIIVVTDKKIYCHISNKFCNCWNSPLS